MRLARESPLTIVVVGGLSGGAWIYWDTFNKFALLILILTFLYAICMIQAHLKEISDHLKK
jgi:hypothetical protein